MSLSSELTCVKALFAVPSIGGSYWATFFPGMVVLGLGMTISVAPLTTTVMSSVEDRHAGTASGINNAVSRIAGMLAVALLGTLAVGAFGSALETRLTGLPVTPEIRRALKAEVAKLAEAQVPSQIRGEQQLVLKQALNESFVQSFRLVMLISAGIALLAALCVALGWMIVPVLPQLRAAVGTSGVALLFAGGLAYTAGAIVYAMRRPDPAPRVFGYHEVFHALVIAAAVCHYAVVAGAVAALR